eukprot:2760250-Rhodomonas_salina.1
MCVCVCINLRWERQQTMQPGPTRAGAGVHDVRSSRREGELVQVCVMMMIGDVRTDNRNGCFE